jgi:hypothetical protein
VRNTLSALVVIGLVWIGYVAWPLYGLTALVRAIDARDVNTVVHYVNFERVRASLTEQIASAYMRVSGIPLLLLHSRRWSLAYRSPIRLLESWFHPKHYRTCWPWAGQLRSCQTRRRRALSE